MQRRKTILEVFRDALRLWVEPALSTDTFSSANFSHETVSKGTVDMNPIIQTYLQG